MSWQSYPLTHMAGFAAEPEPAVYNVGAVAYPRGHILHDFLEARVFRASPARSVPETCNTPRCGRWRSA